MSITIRPGTEKIMRALANASFQTSKEKIDEILHDIHMSSFQNAINVPISDLGPFIYGTLFHCLGVNFTAQIAYGNSFAGGLPEPGFVEWTPFQLACALGNPDVVQYLIKHGADVNTVDAYDRDCVYIAMYMRALLEINPNVKWNPNADFSMVIKLIREKGYLLGPGLVFDVPDMELLIEECVLEYDKTTKPVWDHTLRSAFKLFNINTPYDVFGPAVEESDGTLYWEWWYGEKSSKDLPLQYKEQVEYVKWTLFQYVCACGNSLLVEFLLECGGDQKLRDQMGMNSRDIVEYVSTYASGGLRWSKYKKGKSIYFDDHIATMKTLKKQISFAFPLFSRSTSSFLDVDITGPREIGVKRGQKDTDLDDAKGKFQK
jgi:hypothetical protein